MNTTRTPQVGDLVAITGELPSFGVVTRFDGDRFFFKDPGSNLDVAMAPAPDEPYVVISVDEAKSFLEKLLDAILTDTAYLGEGFANWMREQFKVAIPVRPVLDEKSMSYFMTLAVATWPGDSVRMALMLWALFGWPV